MTSNKEKDKKPVPTLIPRRKKHSLVDFMMMSVDEVYDQFRTLPGAVMVGKGMQRFMYVPATRQNSVLLVAHADSVWDDKEIKLGQTDHRLFSVNEKSGCRADDRCGITMLWKLRNLGHALLIPDGEEKHGQGSEFLMGQEDWRKEINKHQFAIQMDRMNDADLAFYGVASNQFKDWCEKQFKGYKRLHGMWTDICNLCSEYRHKTDCLDGVNISVGYYRQHTTEEYVELSEWHRTLSLLYENLSKEEIPKFHHSYTPPPPPSSYTPHTDSSRGYTGHRCGSYDYMPTSNVNTYKREVSEIDVLSGTLVCPRPDCEGMMDEGEYRQNKNACIYCNEGFQLA